MKLACALLALALLYFTGADASVTLVCKYVDDAGVTHGKEATVASTDSLVKELKRAAAAAFGLTVLEVTLYKGNTQLFDAQTLKSYGLGDGSEVIVGDD